jgi:hypothetical protein
MAGIVAATVLRLVESLIWRAIIEGFSRIAGRVAKAMLQNREKPFVNPRTLRRRAFCAES